MKKIKYIGLIIACAGLLTASCDNEDINEVIKKDAFLVGMGTSQGEIFEDGSNGTIPLVIGNTLSNAATVSVTITPEAGVEYGTHFTTIPDGSSGTITLNLEAGAKQALIEVVPNITPAIDTKKVVFTLESASGGLIKVDGSSPFELTIADQSFNVTVIAFTGFEEPLAGDINNYAAQDGVEQINILDDGNGNRLNSVDYVSVGGEMGFDMSYVPGQEGGADSGLYFGVTNITNEPGEWNIGSFKDGLQAYSTSDADGLAEIVFDEINIPSGTGLLKVRLSTYFVGDSWESSDEFDVFWRTEDGDELILSFRSDGDNMTDAPDGTGNIISDDWFTFDALASNIKNGNLVIQIGSNSGSEVAFIDAVEIGIK